tara:strand:- start:1 stop:579 length:579 start_codon:yes stop_codon:yes gene_type:complete
MAWAKNGTTTLSTAGDDLDVTTDSSVKFNMFMAHELTTGTVRAELNFNSDTGSNYARRTSNNGGTDYTAAVNDNDIKLTDGSVNTAFQIAYVINIATEEKLMIQFNSQASATGAGAAPNRYETVAKWANTSNLITDFQIQNAESGDFATDSNLSVLGSDMTPSPIKVEDGVIFYETDTNKSYVLNGSTWTEL